MYVQIIKIGMVMQPCHIVGIHTHMRPGKTAAVLVRQNIGGAGRADGLPLPLRLAVLELRHAAVRGGGQLKVQRAIRHGNRVAHIFHHTSIAF